MAIAYDPERQGDLYAIQGCFLGYEFEGAGIYRLRGGGPLERILDLPFAHRIGLSRRGGHRFLLAASLAAGKKDKADWSQAGAVYAARLDGDEEPGLEPVLPGLHRNHGFLLAPHEGRPSLLIGASEGLFAIDLESSGPRWPVRQVMGNEVSEVAVMDLDGCGEAEIVTIEPFHGSAVRAYKKTAQGYRLLFEAELQFGHCLLAQSFRGRPAVLVSSRAGGKELLLFLFEPGSLRSRRVVVEAGAAAANMLLVGRPGEERILSANQAAGEIALYTPVA